MKPLIRKIEIATLCAFLLLSGYGIHTYITDYATVVRWQQKAKVLYSQKIEDSKHGLQNVSQKPLPDWVEQRPTKVAFDVYLSTASNIASIIGTILSILAFLGSRKIRKEKQ